MNYLSAMVLLCLTCILGTQLNAQPVHLGIPQSRAPMQSAFACASGQATNVLDVNQVRTRVFNSGGLFGTLETSEFEVPKGGGINAMSAAGLWLGGMIDGNLHFAGTDYGPGEFWPGPLDDQGLPPEDCTPFDRIFRITLRDISAFEDEGVLTEDLLDWPYYLGAPVRDGDGDPNNYDLDAGDRPALIGHQMLWWVMNDRGGNHSWSGREALGVEVQVTAYAVSNSASVLDHTIFFTYKLLNKSGGVFSDFYFGHWADPSLGNGRDDYVGSDSLLNVGFVYNGKDTDEGPLGYGDAPPALGITILESPLSDADGLDNDRDGMVDEEGEMVGLGTFVSYLDDNTITGNPRSGADAYNYMRGLWRDDVSVTIGGIGRSTTDTPTRLMYPAHPPAYWSEEDLEGAGSRNHPGERRFVMAVGPFAMAPGDITTITLGYVWARGEDRLDSVSRMKQAVQQARTTFANGLSLPPPPPPVTTPTLIAPGDAAVGQPTDLDMVWSTSDPAPIDFQLQWALDESFSTSLIDQVVYGTTFQPILQQDQTYYWRVRSFNGSGFSPWSQTRRFTTGRGGLRTKGPLRIDMDSPAFVEVVGPGGADPCGPGAASTYGCEEVGGNYIYRSTNGTATYLMSSIAEGPEATVGLFTPNDFELRFTAEGSYAYHPFTTGTALWVPFEVWDIGNTGPFNENDPSDDIRMVPQLFSDNGGECLYAYGEIEDDAVDSILGRPATDRMYAYYLNANHTYQDWANAVGHLVQASGESCPASPDTDDASQMIDFSRGRALQRVVMLDNVDADGDGIYDGDVTDLEGAVIRFYTKTIISETPLLSNPSDGSRVDTESVVLYWYAPEPLQSFDLQVATEASFSSGLLVEVAQLHDFQFLLRGLQDGQRYFWRVRGRNEQGDVEAWSANSQFHVVRITHTEDQISGIPLTYRLERNYPNPFNAATQITFGIPELTDVRLSVHDVLGRKVATLTDGRLAAGWHRIRWNTEGQSSGVYFYNMQTDVFRKTRQMVLIK